MADFPTDVDRRQLDNATDATTATNALQRDSEADLAAHVEPVAQPSTAPLSEGMLTFICQYCIFLRMLLCLSSPHFVFTLCCLYIMVPVLLLCW
jgi:hypothetical protein